MVGKGLVMSQTNMHALAQPFVIFFNSLKCNSSDTVDSTSWINGIAGLLITVISHWLGKSTEIPDFPYRRSICISRTKSVLCNYWGMGF